ncbi:MAG: acylhydrolase [Lachnospiraceae bacterium]|nr:acylhydrolase [Lachnospiraceae bacterium]
MGDQAISDQVRDGLFSAWTDSAFYQTVWADDGNIETMAVSDNDLALEDSISGNGFASEDLEGTEVETDEGAVEENSVSANCFVTVDESYFDDAAFIGDSRTVGLYDYAGLDNTDFYASSGLTIYKLFEDPDGKFKDGNWTENIEEALERESYGKVYLMIGINEMGTGDVDYFMKHYEAAVERIMELQPDAIIYLEAIMRVSTERSEQGDYIYNEGIDERNERIAALADNKRIFYLDVNEVVCDENGGLIADYTFDGVHLYAQYISIWKQFLMEHAVLAQPKDSGEVPPGSE